MFSILEILLLCILVQGTPRTRWVVHNQFLQKKAQVKAAVRDFINLDGLDTLCKAARDASKSDSEKIDILLNLRHQLGLPTKAPLSRFSDGGLRFGFPRIISVSMETELALRRAVRLVD